MSAWRRFKYFFAISPRGVKFRSFSYRSQLALAPWKWTINFPRYQVDEKAKVLSGCCTDLLQRWVRTFTWKSRQFRFGTEITRIATLSVYPINVLSLWLVQCSTRPAARLKAGLQFRLFRSLSLSLRRAAIRHESREFLHKQYPKDSSSICSHDEH